MHELGIAREILDAALQAAEARGAVRITALLVHVNALEYKIADSLRFHLEQLLRGTIAEGARIEIEETLTEIQCMDCGKIFPLDQQGVCPYCAAVQLRPVASDEFRLAGIDIELKESELGAQFSQSGQGEE